MKHFSFTLLLCVGVIQFSFSQKNIKLRFSTDLVRGISRYSSVPAGGHDWLNVTPLRKQYFKKTYIGIWRPTFSPHQLNLGVYIEAEINEKMDISIGIRNGIADTQGEVNLTADSTISKLGGKEGTGLKENEGGSLIRIPLQFSYKIKDLRKIKAPEEYRERRYPKKQYSLYLVGALTPGWQLNNTIHPPDYYPLYENAEDTMAILSYSSQIDNKFGVGMYLGVKWKIIRTKNSKEILTLMAFYEQGFVNYRVKKFEMINTFKNERYELVTKGRGSQVSLMISFPITIWRKKTD